MNVRKALLFQYDESRMKENGEGHFDVIMRCYDGTEIYEHEGNKFLVN